MWRSVLEGHEQDLENGLVYCAQDWLGAAEYAAEGIVSAKEAASWSGSGSDLNDQARSAARAAMLLAEVSTNASPSASPRLASL